jgi:hypothetical protein
VSPPAGADVALIGKRRRTHARETSQGPVNILIQASALRVLVSCLGGVEVADQQVVRVEAQFNAIKIDQAAQKQARTCHQRQRQRDLHNHQDLAQPRAGRAPDASAPKPPTGIDPRIKET